MVGVTGSIPVVPTIIFPLKQGVSATSSDFGNASSCQNVPRTLPNCLDSLGTRWAICSGFDLEVLHDDGPSVGTAIVGKRSLPGAITYHSPIK